MRNQVVEISDRQGGKFKVKISTEGTWSLSRFGQILRHSLAKHPEPRFRVSSSGKQVPGVQKSYSALGSIAGDWRVIDTGAIRFSRGKAWETTDDQGDQSDFYHFPERDLYLLNMDGEWGIQLWDFEDKGSVNDQGNGCVILDWVVNFAHGRISWVTVD